MKIISKLITATILLSSNFVLASQDIDYINFNIDFFPKNNTNLTTQDNTLRIGGEPYHTVSNNNLRIDSKPCHTISKDNLCIDSKPCHTVSNNNLRIDSKPCHTVLNNNLRIDNKQCNTMLNKNLKFGNKSCNKIINNNLIINNQILNKNYNINMNFYNNNYSRNDFYKYPINLITNRHITNRHIEDIENYINEKIQHLKNAVELYIHDCCELDPDLLRINIDTFNDWIKALSKKYWLFFNEYRVLLPNDCHKKLSEFYKCANYSYVMLYNHYRDVINQHKEVKKAFDDYKISIDYIKDIHNLLIQ